jgi:molecular chaperone GrpE
MKVTDRRRLTPEGEENPEADAPAWPETTDPGAAAPPPADPPPDLTAQLAEQAARIDELSRAYARQLHDAQAFRQRMEREKERLVEAEKLRLVGVLLESHDELELAWRASRTPPGHETAALRDLREGVRLTLVGLEKRIAELGVERVDVLGLPYDPRVAEAVDMVVVGSPAQDGAVVEEIRPGWRLGEKVVRPARVRVGQLPRA